jgi:GTP pyrophosphokinase
MLYASDNMHAKENELRTDSKSHPNTKKSKIAVDYNLDDLEFSVANCCHPLPGDDIIAFSPEGTHNVVHRTNCNEAIGLMTRFSKQVIHAKWENKPKNTFLGGIKISGFDRKNMISDIIRVISDDMRFNIRSFHIDTTGELFEAYISLFVHNTLDIKNTVDKLTDIDGISSASRMIQFTKT